ncbi:hypothetical protein CK203_035751 [Vitis vinifera]|uniref:Uncharacterized protein n=1 Tax=Vitis vinifera TaxID=29760 RepID=A0A438FZ35_VITVI|nr:hypothetical protein CK203_035751 [Vitis vinifera]
MEDRSKGVFASDDVVVDEEVRRKVESYYKFWIEIGRRWCQVAIKIRDSLNVQKTTLGSDVEGRRTEIRRAERRTLHDSYGFGLDTKKIVDVNEVLNGTTTGNSSYKHDRNETVEYKSVQNISELGHKNGDSKARRLGHNNEDSKARRKSELSGHIYADGKRWDISWFTSPLIFFKLHECVHQEREVSDEVFMVWNSPPWMLALDTNVVLRVYSPTIEMLVLWYFLRQLSLISSKTL